MNMKGKTKMRLFVKEKQKIFSETEIKHASDKICNSLEHHESFVKANIIMSYWPMAKEVDIRVLNIKYCQSKKIFLPVIEGNDIKIKLFEGFDSLKSGKFGILEPDSDDFYELNDIELIIVPGLAFDKQNNRLGRGKGYYDRFIKETNAFKIGVCFDFQLFDIVPADPHDVAVDLVITNK